MKEEEVFVVIIDDVYECDGSNSDVMLFATEEAARNHMATLKEAFDGIGYEYDETSSGFQYYKEGEYAVNHYDVRLVKRVIND